MKSQSPRFSVLRFRRASALHPIGVQRGDDQTNLSTLSGLDLIAAVQRPDVVAKKLPVAKLAPLAPVVNPKIAHAKHSLGRYCTF